MHRLREVITSDGEECRNNMKCSIQMLNKRFECNAKDYASKTTKKEKKSYTNLEQDPEKFDPEKYLEVSSILEDYSVIEGVR